MDAFFDRLSAFRWVSPYQLCATSLRLVPLFVQGRLHARNSQKPTIKMLTRSFILKFSYINDILSLNNSKYGDFVDRIYPIDLEIRDTTGAAIGRLHTLTYTSKLTVKTG
jgi:hypothetical protein